MLGPIFAHSVRPLLVNKDLWSLKLEEVFVFVFVLVFVFVFAHSVRPLLVNKDLIF